MTGSGVELGKGEWTEQKKSANAKIKVYITSNQI